MAADSALPDSAKGILTIQMALLLYCVTPMQAEIVLVTTGVCDVAVRTKETARLRAYFGEITDPAVCLGDADSLKKAAASFQQVLREVLARTTPIPFHFPTLLESEEALELQIRGEEGFYCDAFLRIGDAVQYELIASWEADGNADTATPVSGREYLQRRAADADRAFPHWIRS